MKLPMPNWMGKALSGFAPDPPPMPIPPPPAPKRRRRTGEISVRDELERAAKRAAGGYSAGNFADRLTGPWSSQPKNVDELVALQLRTLRARSREESTTPHLTKFLQMVQTNVCGPAGFVLQAKALLPDGSRDQKANKILERRFGDWSKAKNCDYLRKLTWREMQLLILRSIAIDGEVLIRKVRDPKVNEFGFALHLLDPELLDVDRNEEHRDGGFTRFGIEYDSVGRPRAYHLSKPQRTNLAPYYSKVDAVRIPADEIIHLFLSLQVGQKRGFPWCSPVLWEMHTMNAYKEAVVLNARAGASKSGHYERDPALTEEDYIGDREDDDGNFEEDIEPLTIRKLPAGWKFNKVEYEYPDGEYWPFMKAGLRTISAGLGVSYFSLAQDLEAVNFSSMRGGVQEERDGWMVVQEWVVEHLHDDVYAEWLHMALMMQALEGLGLDGEEEYGRSFWQAKRWDWVDPLKDASAMKLEYDNNVESLTGWARRKGRDLEQVFEEIKAERDLAKQYGIELPIIVAALSATSNGKPPVDEDEEKESDRIDALLLARVNGVH